MADRQIARHRIVARPHLVQHRGTITLVIEATAKDEVESRAGDVELAILDRGKIRPIVGILRGRLAQNENVPAIQRTKVSDVVGAVRMRVCNSLRSFSSCVRAGPASASLGPA